MYIVCMSLYLRVTSSSCNLEKSGQLWNLFWKFSRSWQAF